MQGPCPGVRNADSSSRSSTGRSCRVLSVDLDLSGTDLGHHDAGRRLDDALASALRALNDGGGDDDDDGSSGARGHNHGGRPQHPTAVGTELRLSLARCNLGPSGVRAVCSSLPPPLLAGARNSPPSADPPSADSTAAAADASSSSSRGPSRTVVAALDLTRNGMGADGGRAVGRALAGTATANLLSSLRTLVVSLNDLKAEAAGGRGSSGGGDGGGGGGKGGPNPSAAERIGRALATDANSTLRELVVDRCALGPDGAAALAAAIGGSFGGVGVGVGGGTASRCRLTRLELEGNMIGPEGGRAFGSALRSLAAACDAARGDNLAANSTTDGEALQDLGLRNNRIGGIGAQSMAKALSDPRCPLCRLDLALNDLRDVGASAIGDALRTNVNLVELNLERNDVGPTGATSIGLALAFNSTLRRLVLSGNDAVGDVGAAAVGGGLARPDAAPALEDLIMVGCGVGPGGAGSIGAALARRRGGGEGVPVSSLLHLDLRRNPHLGPDGGEALARGLAGDIGLRSLHLRGCNLGRRGGSALATALRHNRSLRVLDAADNDVGNEAGPELVEAVVGHPSLVRVDLSDNAIECIHVDCQLRLARRQKGRVQPQTQAYTKETEVEMIETAEELPPLQELELDLSDNPLSSPPLGRRAGPTQLREYLSLLLSEPTAVERVRLMVLGFGGVGKSTFCRAVMTGARYGETGKEMGTSPRGEGGSRDGDDLAAFHSTLVPLDGWDEEDVADWARRLGTGWSAEAASVLATNRVRGADLRKLVDWGDGVDEDEDDGSNGGGRRRGKGSVSSSSSLSAARRRCRPSAALVDLAGGTMAPEQVDRFARAIGSLLNKGYLSTVGVVKVDGTLPLEGGGDGGGEPTRRQCSLVDFAGQVEFLVSHQLLLSSMRTVCMVIQPAPSFVAGGDALHPPGRGRPAGGWAYWSRFLRALGDRRPGSLLLAVSKLDMVPGDDAAGDTTSLTRAAVDGRVRVEFDALRLGLAGVVGGDGPIMLDYRAGAVGGTMAGVRRELSRAADAVARDWWVPASYERLADLVRRLGDERKTARELPILSRRTLRAELDASADPGLKRMRGDPKLLRRGVEYLEAVGDVLTDDRLDCLLLDPVGWFASFLAHFIRDEDVVTSVQLDSRAVRRGVVSLDEVVTALRHDYTDPEHHVPEVMSLVCRLELCVPYSEGTTGTAYLFPCLLPPASAHDLANHWPTSAAAHCSVTDTSQLVIRGHRFRESTGFLPPGLFPGLLARFRHFPDGVVHSSRLWNDHAVLLFGKARVLLRLDLGSATLDVLAAAPTAEDLFVGAAKGQASVVVWMAHLIKIFVSCYRQLGFEESWLCPSCKCHGMDPTCSRVSENEPFCPYSGTEFALQARKRYHGDHDCEAEGCWHHLGLGHKLEPTVIRDGMQRFCTNCHQEARFALRPPC